MFIKNKHKTFLLYIQIHMVQTTVNKYVIAWCIYNEIQYAGKFDMLTYFFGTNSVVVLSSDCIVCMLQEYTRWRSRTRSWASQRTYWRGR